MRTFPTQETAEAIVGLPQPHKPPPSDDDDIVEDKRGAKGTTTKNQFIGSEASLHAGCTAQTEVAHSTKRALHGVGARMQKTNAENHKWLQREESGLNEWTYCIPPLQQTDHNNELAMRLAPDWLDCAHHTKGLRCKHTACCEGITLHKKNLLTCR